MQNKTLKKLKKTLILSGTYALLSAVLLLNISTAKYADNRLAYTCFGAASFNSVILGDCTESGTLNKFEDTLYEETVLGRTLRSDDCIPGMTYNAETNSAKIIPFSVANGTAAANASEASVDYTIKLRTTRNMPLKFTLAAVGSSEPKLKLYESGEPELVESSGSGSSGIEKIQWYEWKFREAAASAETPAQPAAEKVFSLIGGSLHLQNYQLIIEWPIDGDTLWNNVPDNSTKYMKELDLLEVLVTVSSKNHLNDDHTTYALPANAIYGKGLIILDPKIAPDDNGVFTYSNLVDLRAFYKETGESTEKIYDFTVNNGVGIGVKQSEDYIYTDFSFELKVPYTVLDEENGAQATKDYAYELQFNKNGSYQTITASKVEYRLYNVLKYNQEFAVPADGETAAAFGVTAYPTEYNTYVTVNKPANESSQEWLELLTSWTAEKSPYRLYKVYTFTEPTKEESDDSVWLRLTNKTADNEGNYVDYPSSRSFRLVLKNSGNIDEEGALGDTAFANKLEIITRATLSGKTDKSGGAGQ